MNPEPAAADPLVRVRLDVAYDGTDFSGWAVQPNRRTVQAELEAALATVLRLPPPRLTVAGRTDAGVHARGQVAHLDLPASAWSRSGDRLLRQLAGVLPADLRVGAVSVAPPEFDARFSALWRRYVYRISTAPGGVDPCGGTKCSPGADHWTPRRWPRRLVRCSGSMDFVAFCRARVGATTLRTLESLDVIRTGDDVVCTVQADAFCHSMVRSLVGALLAVGDGRHPIEWPAGLLARTGRADEVVVAPARGLTLVEVGYPPDEELSARAALTRTLRIRSDGD